MMKFLRSQSRTVLTVILAVIALGFLFYGNAGNLLTSGGGRTSNDYGRIDGEDLSVADLYDAVRDTRESLIIHGQSQELKQPGESAQIAQEAWRQLLLLHEADRLHITVSDQELVDYIHSLPIFQKDGVYSPQVYESQMAVLQNILRSPTDSGADSIANAKATFENVLRNDLRTHAVSRALLSTIRTSAQDVSTQFEKIYGPATVSVVTFDPKSFVAAAKVTPAEVEAEYKANPRNPDYRTKEKRKVDYVLFLLSPEQEKLPDAQKTAAKEALGQKALDFALAFQPEPSANGASTAPMPDFMAEARKHGLAPVTTDFFADDTQPTGVPPSPGFNSAAFSLSQDDAISKVVELDNGVAVLHLAEIQPSDLRPLDEVKSDILKQLQQSKGVQAAEAAAQAVDQQLKEAVAKGTDFKVAAMGMKLKVETLPAFVPIKVPPTDQRLQTIAYVVSTLTPGQVSNAVPVPADETTLVIHLDSRATADPSGLAEFQTRFQQSEDEQLRSMVYTDWANWKSKQAGTHRPPDLESYGALQ
jgi:peptidyl-prolyl cis-trans isomerase D